MGLDRAQMRSLIAGSLLHDMGKIAIDDQILRKPGKFTPEEMTIMRSHVKEGVNIVGELNMIPGAADVVAFHHERWDGNGYPYGLAQSKIPLVARIFAVADVFDALSARRKYKEPFPFDRAMALIREGAGAHFDADIVTEFETIASRLYDSIENRDEADTLAMLDANLAQYFSDVAAFDIDSRV
jgi:HD-GYP domain-containing protein (c-di-GMP phosphodiesterase class II)